MHEIVFAAVVVCDPIELRLHAGVMTIRASGYSTFAAA